LFGVTDEKVGSLLPTEFTNADLLWRMIVDGIPVVDQPVLVAAALENADVLRYLAACIRCLFCVTDEKVGGLLPTEFTNADLLWRMIVDGIPVVDQPVLAAAALENADVLRYLAACIR
jgi:hypothetical protein